MRFKDIVEIEFQQDYYKQLHQFVENEYLHKTIFPPKENIFRALNLCDYENVKVVILGQDPYHELHQANGLAFSVYPGVRIPPSLVNIYKELQDDLGTMIPNHGDLTKWAKQGVLLLNNVLTVEEGRANSHSGKGWETFTLNIVKALNKSQKPLVRHLVLESAHPSPLSAHRGFFGSHPFSKANEFLIRNGMPMIDWQIDNI